MIKTNGFADKFKVHVLGRLSIAQSNREPKSARKQQRNATPRQRYHQMKT